MGTTLEKESLSPNKSTEKNRLNEHSLHNKDSINTSANNNTQSFENIDLTIKYLDHVEHIPISVFYNKSKISNLSGNKWLQEILEAFISENTDTSQTEYITSHLEFFQNGNCIDLLFDVSNCEVKTVQLLKFDKKAIIKDIDDYRTLRIIVMRSKTFLLGKLKWEEPTYQSQLTKMLEFVNVYLSPSVAGQDSSKDNSRSKSINSDMNNMLQINKDFDGSIEETLNNTIHEGSPPQMLGNCKTDSGLVGGWSHRPDKRKTLSMNDGFHPKNISEIEFTANDYNVDIPYEVSFQSRISLVPRSSIDIKTHMMPSFQDSVLNYPSDTNSKTTLQIPYSKTSGRNPLAKKEVSKEMGFKKSRKSDFNFNVKSFNDITRENPYSQFPKDSESIETFPKIENILQSLIKRLPDSAKKSIKAPENGIPIIGPMKLKSKPNSDKEKDAYTDTYYIGQFYNGKKSGWGKMLSKNEKGDVQYYKGYWMNDKHEGTGVMIYFNKNDNKDTFNEEFGENVIDPNLDFGQLYYGEWLEGDLENYGEYFTNKGISYIGGFKKFNYHGCGVLENDTGGRYEGHFCNNLRHGKGKMVFTNGDMYDGFFIMDMMSGQGKYIWNDIGKVYEGEWKSNLMHGEGVLSYSSGTVFTGMFLNGIKEGCGQFEYTNGSVWRGNFSKGVRVDEGIEIKKVFFW